MAKIRQYYDPPGVPLVVDADPQVAVDAWWTQRSRLRTWLDELDDADWDGPTRCAGWDTHLLVRHLGSACQFLGYTLHEAAGNMPTTLLRGMDTRTTVAAAAEGLGDQTPEQARALLADTDAAVDAALGRLGPDGLAATAEGPPGHMAAHLVVSHFLFDSWVHEYDLLLPRGERPPVDVVEVTVVVGYLAGLAVVATASSVSFELRLDHPDLLIAVAADGPVTTVSFGSSLRGAGVIEGAAPDVIDRMTGRPGDAVTGDVPALAVIDEFANVLAT